MEVCEVVEQLGAGTADDLHEVDELISDLAALLDAGLVVVHETVLGPPRYGVGAEPGDRRMVQVGAREEVTADSART
jgi:hypothetical protein